MFIVTVTNFIVTLNERHLRFSDENEQTAVLVYTFF